MNTIKCLALIYLFVIAIPQYANGTGFHSLKRVDEKRGFYYINSDHFLVTNSVGKPIQRPPLLRKGAEVRVLIAMEGQLGGVYGSWGILMGSYYPDPKMNPTEGVFIKLDEHIHLKEKFYIIGALPDELAKQLNSFGVHSGDTIASLEILKPKYVNINKVKGKYLDRFDHDSIPSKYLKLMDVQLDYDSFKEVKHYDGEYYDEVYYNFFIRYYETVCAICFILCLILFGKRIRLSHVDNLISVNGVPFWGLKRIRGTVIDKQVHQKTEITTSHSPAYTIGNTVVPSSSSITIETKHRSEIYVQIDQNNVELIAEPRIVPVYMGATVSIIKMIALKSMKSQNACFYVHDLNKTHFCSNFSIGKFLRWKLPFQFDFLKACLTFALSYLMTMLILSVFVKGNYSEIAEWPNVFEAFSLLFKTIFLYSLVYYLIIKLAERIVMFFYAYFRISKWIKKEASLMHQSA